MRICKIEEELVVVRGLFDELKQDEEAPLLKYQKHINQALADIRVVVHQDPVGPVDEED